MYFVLSSLTSQNCKFQICKYSLFRDKFLFTYKCILPTRVAKSFNTSYMSKFIYLLKIACKLPLGISEFPQEIRY